jgi:hypothetical protein
MTIRNNANLHSICVSRKPWHIRQNSRSR